MARSGAAGVRPISNSISAVRRTRARSSSEVVSGTESNAASPARVDEVMLTEAIADHAEAAAVPV